MDTRLINSKNIRSWIGASGVIPIVNLGFLYIFQSIIAKAALELNLQIQYVVMFSILYLCIYCFFRYRKNKVVIRINEYIKNQKVNKSKVIDKSNKNYNLYLEKYPLENYMNRINKLIGGRDSIYKRETNTVISIIDKVVKNIDYPTNKIVNMSISEGLNRNSLEAIEIEAYNVKNILEKIIEASKLSSNVINFSKKETDINFLIRQKVLDFLDDINEIKLELIDSIDEKEYIMKLDGERMSKALDIYLLNIINHSQSNTRVYISACSTENMYSIELKNISKKPLNMKYIDLVNEKDGLSLEIAKALIEGQGGKTLIDIDGDLFKVTIVLYKEE